MTVLSAVLITAIVAAPAFFEATGIEFIAESIAEPPVAEQLGKHYVSNEYIQQQNYDTQMYRYNQSIQQLEREMIRPGTTMDQKNLYQNQKSQLERQKADEQRNYRGR